MPRTTECTAASCSKPATHTLVVVRNGGTEDNASKVPYCIDDAIYFAGWIPYAYTMMVVRIEPSFAEWFGLRK